MLPSFSGEAGDLDSFWDGDDGISAPGSKGSFMGAVQDSGPVPGRRVQSFAKLRVQLLEGSPPLTEAETLCVTSTGEKTTHKSPMHMLKNSFHATLCLGWPRISHPRS